MNGGEEEWIEIALRAGGIGAWDWNIPDRPYSMVGPGL